MLRNTFVKIRQHIPLLMLQIADKLDEDLFAALYNYFSNSKFWFGSHQKGFDFARASAVTRRERFAMSSAGIHRLIMRRYIRYENWDALQLGSPALCLGLHGRPWLFLFSKARLGGATAYVVRFPERVTHLKSTYPLLPDSERLPVKFGVLHTVKAKIASGYFVALAPDAPDAIVGSCFRLVEEGVTMEFQYPTVDQNGVPRLYTTVYSGPANRKACADAFLSFVRRFNTDLASLSVRWEPLPSESETRQ